MKDFEKKNILNLKCDVEKTLYHPLQ